MALRAGALCDCRAYRQYAGPRSRLYALWRTFPFCLRHGSRAGQWRSAAHGYGLAAELQYLAGLQVGIWPLPGWHLYPIQLWHCHQIRLLADACAAGYKPFTVQYQNEEDIVEIVETIRPLAHQRTIPNAAVIAHALYEAPFKAKRSDYVSGPGSIPDEAVARSPGS